MVVNYLEIYCVYFNQAASSKIYPLLVHFTALKLPTLMLHLIFFSVVPLKSICLLLNQSQIDKVLSVGIIPSNVFDSLLGLLWLGSIVGPIGLLPKCVV